MQAPIHASTASSENGPVLEELMMVLAASQHASPAAMPFAGRTAARFAAVMTGMMIGHALQLRMGASATDFFWSQLQNGGERPHGFAEYYWSHGGPTWSSDRWTLETGAPRFDDAADPRAAVDLWQRRGETPESAGPPKERARRKSTLAVDSGFTLAAQFGFLAMFMGPENAARVLFDMVGH